jgi:hypothetical protein
MPSVTERRPGPPALWPSLVISAALATASALGWIFYRDAHEEWRLRILLAPVYTPLAFGLIWPAFIVLQTLSIRSVSPARPPRVWVALIVFIASAVCSAPFILGEYKSLMSDRERGHHRSGGPDVKS